MGALGLLISTLAVMGRLSEVLSLPQAVSPNPTASPSNAAVAHRMVLILECCRCMPLILLMVPGGARSFVRISATSKSGSVSCVHTPVNKILRLDVNS